MGSFFPEESFQSLDNYRRALKQTPWRLRQRVFRRSSVEEETGPLVRRSGYALKKNLNWWDFMWFTIGAVIGAGVFVLTGQEAHNSAGPSVIVSYAAAGFSAMLSVIIYTEFGVELPAAGGSFSYFRVELGEFVAFISAGNGVLESVIGGAAVARAWTGYFAALIGTQPNKIRIHVPALAENYNNLDPIAVAVIVVTTVVAIWTTKGSSILNYTASIVNMLIIGFVIVAGLVHAKAYNFTHSGVPNLKDGFAPYGAHGMFHAASVLFFAYLGFDSVSSMAEETKNPKRDIPIGMIGAMIIVTVVYMMMALTLVLMVPYGLIQDEAPFSYAFQYVGWNWAKYLVALGALKGMTTVILIGNVSTPRYFTHIGRTHMIPPWFAEVNRWTKTPINSIVIISLGTCIVAFFTDLSVLGNLLSVSTLFIFTLIGIALLFRRYYDPVETTTREFRIFLMAVATVVASSIAIAGYWGVTGTEGKWVGYVIIIPIWFLATLAIRIFCPMHRHPKVWGVPLVPWLPSLSIVVNAFLLGSIDKISFYRFAILTAIIIIWYLLIGLHASHDAACELTQGQDPPMKGDGEPVSYGDESGPQKPAAPYGDHSNRLQKHAAPYGNHSDGLQNPAPSGNGNGLQVPTPVYSKSGLDDTN